MMTPETLAPYGLPGWALYALALAIGFFAGAIVVGLIALHLQRNHRRSVQRMRRYLEVL